MDKFQLFRTNLFEMYQLFRSSGMYLTSVVNGITGLRMCVVIWNREPEGDLPSNVLWLFSEPYSSKHLNLYRRVSLQPTGGHANTWERVFDYDSVWDMQEYLEPPKPFSFEIATQSVLGLSRLSFPSEKEIPEAVIDTDERLYNARVPTEHTHPEKPATMLATATGQVDFNSEFVEKGVLRSPDGKHFSHTKIKFSEVQNKP